MHRVQAGAERAKMDRRDPRGPLPSVAFAYPGPEHAQVSHVGVLRALRGASEYRRDRATRAHVAGVRFDNRSHPFRREEHRVLAGMVAGRGSEAAREGSDVSASVESADRARSTPVAVTRG